MWRLDARGGEQKRDLVGRNTGTIVMDGNANVNAVETTAIDRRNYDDEMMISKIDGEMRSLVKSPMSTSTTKLQKKGQKKKKPNSTPRRNKKWTDSATCKNATNSPND